ncbi:MAG: polysaccharide deacetylase family protein, partial [Bacteroidales bacterium]|nr:polysaccharide deacetylase family protein [Bacteroidales bacterium]
DSTYFSPRHISSGQFEKHLKYYIKNFDIVTVSEAFNMYRNEVVPKRKTISISFDDGYKNNLDIVLPLLEKYRVKATFFIAGMCTGDMKIETLWSDVISVLRHFYPKEIIEIGPEKFISYRHETTNERIQDHIKKLSPDKRDKNLDNLIDSYSLADKIKKIPEEVWKLMTRKELITFSRSKMVDIGAHGYLHYNLGNIDLKEAEKDLSLAKSVLEEAIQKPVFQLAYPDGSYSESVKDVAQRLGYENQLAVNYRLQSDGRDERILNRHAISSTTTYESNMFFLNFAFRKTGFL